MMDFTYRGILTVFILNCKVYSEKALEQYEHVSNYNDQDFSTNVLWQTSGKSPSVCGNICASNKKCLSYMWNKDFLLCKGFSKIFYSQATLSWTGNRYYKLKDKCSSNGYTFGQPSNELAICFKFHTTPMDFDSAQAECQKTSATLFQILDLETIEFLASYLINYPAPDDVWVDGTDAELEDVWKYFDGTNVTYLRWANTQPSHRFFYSIGAYEHCLSLQDAGFGSEFSKMNDKACSDPLPFLCQLHIYA